MVTARNFIRYAERWQSPHLTSFFTASPALPRHRPIGAESFGYNQALKIPAQLVHRLVALEPLRHRGWLQDNALGAALVSGELVIYHRPSLVQHVGRVSLCRPGGRFPVAADFPGEVFDCLSLLDLNSVQCRTTRVPILPSVSTHRTANPALTQEAQVSKMTEDSGSQVSRERERDYDPSGIRTRFPTSLTTQNLGAFSPH